MSYIKDSLGNDENIVEQFEFHWSIWIGFFVLAAISVLSFIGWIISLFNPNTENVSVSFIISTLFGLGALYQFIEIKTSERALTNKRLVTKSGIISVHTEETRLPKIETIEVRLGVIDRLLGTGTLKITGTGTSSMLVTHLCNPNSAKKVIESALE